MTAITPWHWIGFIAFVLACIALDLGILRRRPRPVKLFEAAAWSALWFSLAMLFAGALWRWRGHEDAAQFAAGYFIELSLSLDNLLVIALIFAAFKTPPEFQHRVLVFGILGALVMRGVMIGVGAELVRNFEWVLYVFGAFLVFAGLKLLFEHKGEVRPEKNPVLRLVRKVFPVAVDFDGQKFFTRLNGRLALTPLALVLVLIETSDLIFAVDSVPAVFSVTRSAFIVFTSNVFAILGLRSLYFLLAGALGCFRYLKIGLSIVLAFVGVKMLLDPHESPPRWFQIEISTHISLLVIAAILSISIAVSIIAPQQKTSTTTDKHK